MLFAKLSDDVILNILDKLEDDPRHWSRLACVSTKFSSLIRTVCWKRKCHVTIPSVISDLLSDGSDSPPGGWSSLNKLAFCCPGLIHSGVLLENSDFGLERELGPDENYRRTVLDNKIPVEEIVTESSSAANGQEELSGCTWSMFDDLYFDTVYNVSENHDEDETLADTQLVENQNSFEIENRSKCNDDKKRKACATSSSLNSRSLKSHMASGVWNLRREQGNKLLASRFRCDCLYICDWPGCVHIEEKRNYMLFRGVFRNFKRSRVWRTINDGNRSRIDLNCAFCSCKETWDLHSAFCLRQVFGYHDDGEPVVRAYVCENGHVSGAWTELPLYT